MEGDRAPLVECSEAHAAQDPDFAAETEAGLPVQGLGYQK